MIKLKKLILKNFKGIKDMTIDFADITNIYGDNAAGKTSIFDAFCWLLFGKDSLDRQKFDIQTLDENNNIIHHLEHEVTGVLDIDGTLKTFKKTLKEKWPKKKGESEPKLTGTTTDYEIDDIPVKQKEYQEMIKSLMDENLFKMITNPFYFNSLHWTKQREILFEIIGNIDDENIIDYKKELAPLKQLLGEDDVDTFNKKVKAAISKLKEKVKDIPARIDENNSNIVNIDFLELEKEKSNKQVEINSIDEQIADASKANDGKLKLQEQLFKAKAEYQSKSVEAHKNMEAPFNKISKKYNEVYKKLQDEKCNLSSLEIMKRENENNINHLQNQLQTAGEEKKVLLTKYHAEDDKQFEFDDTLSYCPHCGRPYESDKIEEIKENALIKFNEQKKSAIDNILTKGKSKAGEIASIEENIKAAQLENKTLTENILNISMNIQSLEKEVQNIQEQKESLSVTNEVHFEGEEELKAKINELTQQVEQFQEADNSALKARKVILQGEIEQLTKELAKKDNNSILKKRIEQLLQEEKDLQVKIAELEGQQFICEDFIRTKVELLENRINEKFKGAVTFKLFINHIGGGLEECCEALINGVPFSNANNAAKYNAGLSIINTLCEHYSVSAPIFIDNAEGINELNHTDSQLIRLIVSKDKNLKVEVEA